MVALVVAAAVVVAVYAAVNGKRVRVKSEGSCVAKSWIMLTHGKNGSFQVFNSWCNNTPWPATPARLNETFK